MISIHCCNGNDMKRHSLQTSKDIGVLFGYIPLICIMQKQLFIANNMVNGLLTKYHASKVLSIVIPYFHNQILPFFIGHP